MNYTSRKYCFTCFKMDIDFNIVYNDYKEFIRFLVIGKETCPNTKKEHYQGYIQFFEPVRTPKLQWIIGNKCHCESQRGTDFQASNYCKKDNKYVSFGKPSKQGQRTDLEDLRRLINKGATHSKCYKEHFSSYTRYRHNLDKYRETILYEKAKKWRNVDVKILSGPTGCGKTSKYLYDDKGNYLEDVFNINCSELTDRCWFDGYEGQTTLILDEFRNDIKLGKLLSLLDGHICRLQIKGGVTYALWNKVIITTNLKKFEIFPNIRKDMIDPLWRRVKIFTDLYECPEVTKGNTDTLDTTYNIEKKYNLFPFGIIQGLDVIN